LYNFPDNNGVEMKRNLPVTSEAERAVLREKYGHGMVAVYYGTVLAHARGPETLAEEASRMCYVYDITDTEAISVVSL
jgi:hypothetical protein